VSDLPLLDPAEPTDATGPDVDLGVPPAADEDRPGRPRRRWLFIGAIGVLIVAAAVTVPLVITALRGGAKLSTPTTIGGLHHDTTADAAQTADYLREALAADVSLGSSIGAVYTDPDDRQRSVLLFGGTAKASSPDNELDHALGLLNDQTGSVTGLHTVAAGPLGGTMKCGTSNGDGGAMSVCGWADSGSVVVALFPGRTVDESANLMRQIRASVEQDG
jgi:hypothetical protein